ncbi:MAG TPA: hypothetical protein VE981_13660 [Planctomycetota bacterium]|nr:hypothetical protein [Planctomycetota bacterium]
MNCLSCNVEIPDSLFAEWEKTEQFKGGRFSCPTCSAEHVRREIGKTPTGEPLYTFRLWGHLTSVRRQPVPAAAGDERRHGRRPKSWR